MDSYEPFMIYRSLEHFLAYRNKETPENFKLTQDQFINKFESQGFYKIETGGKNKLMVLILSETGRYFAKTADFVRLAQTNKWEELAVIVPRGFFLKKNFLSKAQEIFRNAKKERNHFGVYPYGIFTMEIPRHESVPKHTVMAEDEVKAVTDYFLMSKSELPTAFHTDPAVVWCGGRPGDLVKIERDSEATGKAITIRLVTEDPFLGAEIYSRVIQ